MQQKFGPGSGAARRFADEARITGQLQHPNIPAVHDLGTLPDGRPFLAMKLIKGDTLDEQLKRRAAPSADRGRFVAAFEQVCHAVEFAHAHGVIHRDLKPANVMVGNFGEVQVMDWGLAKVLGERPRVSGPSDPDETLGWLRADLVLRRKEAAGGAADRAAAVRALAHWLQDPDFAAVRPGLMRIGLPAAERAEWDSLWADVRSALAEAQKPAPPPALAPHPQPAER